MEEKIEIEVKETKKRTKKEIKEKDIINEANETGEK